MADLRDEKLAAIRHLAVQLQGTLPSIPARAMSSEEDVTEWVAGIMRTIGVQLQKVCDDQGTQLRVVPAGPLLGHNGRPLS